MPMMEKVTLFCMIAVLSSLKCHLYSEENWPKDRVYWKSKNVTKCGPGWHPPDLLLGWRKQRTGVFSIGHNGALFFLHRSELDDFLFDGEIGINVKILKPRHLIIDETGSSSWPLSGRVHDEVFGDGFVVEAPFCDPITDDPAPSWKPTSICFAYIGNWNRVMRNRPDRLMDPRGCLRVPLR